MIPATNPPSRMSSPSSPASATIPNTSTTAMRTAACPLDSMVRSSALQPVLIERTPTRAARTATTTNAVRMTALVSVLCDVRTSVISRIGPNSPTAPAPSRKRPKRVISSPASRRMGIRVPRAVVASAEPVYASDTTTPASASAPAREYASTSDSPHPTLASRSGVPRIRSKSISNPAKKNNMPRPRFEKKRMNRSGSARSSTWGPITMPSRSSRTTTGSGSTRPTSIATRAATAAAQTMTKNDVVSRSITTCASDAAWRRRGAGHWRARPPGRSRDTRGSR